MAIIKKTVLLIFLLCTQILHAQDKKMVLRIIDQSTGMSLPYCTICTENKTNGKTDYFTTNINGLADYPYSGKTVISMSYVGYQTLIDTLNVYLDTLTFELIPRNIGVGEVVVTGQNKPVSVDKSIYNIKLIGAEQIDRQASNNLAELLNNQLNVQINNDPSTGSSVKLQGISGENVKILVDGVPVIGRMDGNIDLSQINLDEVDHIEIVEGPMSVMYGSNALAGVINIITKENKYAKTKAGADTYYESIGTYNVNGNYYWRGQINSIGINLGRNFFQGYSPDQKSRSMQWKPKEQYKASMYYTFEENRLKVKFKTDNFRERLLNRDNPPPPYFNFGHDTWFHTVRLNNSLRTEYEITQSTNFNLLLSYSYYDRKKKKYAKDLTKLETRLSPNPSDHDTTTFNSFIARGVYNFNSSDKKITYQLGFDFDLETAIGKRIKDQSQEIGDYAGFATLQWSLGKNFTLQPAVRASYNTRYDAPLTPSINLKYQQQKTIYRLSYSRGFRAPSLKELYLYFYDSNHQIEGNNKLDAESSHNYSLAVSHKNTVARQPFELRLVGFYNRINNKITLIQVNAENSLLYRNENIGRFESLGGTFTTQFTPCQFVNFSAGIAQTGIRDNTFNANKFIFNTNANANFTLRMWKNTTVFSVFYKYLGRYPRYYYGTNDNIELGYINDYHNMDISLSRKFFKNTCMLSAGAKNLFNNTNISGTGAGGGGAHSSSSTSKLVGWGRTFFIALKYNFYDY